MAQWIEIDFDWGHWVFCSACGEGIKGEGGSSFVRGYRFCPWCGAKMDDTVWIGERRKAENDK